MSDVFFTADFHIDHGNILHLSNRPFTSIEEMNEVLIDNWNLLVRPGDTVYFLGDMSFSNPAKTEQLLRRLQGQIHVVQGNHDSAIRHLKQHFAWYGDYKEIKVAGQHIVLSHYPLLVWNRAHHGSWMLHGHCHGNLDPAYRNGPMRDVGVDCSLYYPIDFETLREELNGKLWSPIDHHSRSER